MSSSQFACRLAAKNHIALVADMYGAGAHFTEPADEAAQAYHDPAVIRSLAVAWYDLLKARADTVPDRVAAIGYCLSGKCVLELARSGADVKLAVSFHGTLTTHALARRGEVKPLVALYCGEHDPFAPRAHVEALIDKLRTAEARWHSTIFGDACHAFTTREDGGLPVEGLAYDALADAVSWNGMLEATIGQD